MYDGLASLLAPPPRRCCACGATAAAMPRCSRCKAMNYCGAECQRGHWHAHKRMCKALAAPPCVGPPSVREVLLVTGLGSLGPEDFYTERLRAAMQERNDLHVTTVSTDTPHPFAQVGAALSTGRFAACVVLGVGSSGDKDDADDLFTSLSVRMDLVNFVRGGGTLLLQGEGVVSELFGWFGKPEWYYSTYTRTAHTCWATADPAPHWAANWYPYVEGGCVSDYNVKAAMLSGVSPTDCLYGTADDARTYSMVPSMAARSLEPGLCSIAFARCGAGCFGFFGDVNAEEDTQDIVTALVGQRLPLWPQRCWSPTRECWRASPLSTRRAVLTVLSIGARAPAVSVRVLQLPGEVWYQILMNLALDDIGGHMLL